MKLNASFSTISIKNGYDIFSPNFFYWLWESKTEVPNHLGGKKHKSLKTSCSCPQMKYIGQLVSDLLGSPLKGLLGIKQGQSFNLGKNNFTCKNGEMLHYLRPDLATYLASVYAWLN